MGTKMGRKHTVIQTPNNTCRARDAGSYQRLLRTSNGYPERPCLHRRNDFRSGNPLGLSGGGTQKPVQAEPNLSFAVRCNPLFGGLRWGDKRNAFVTGKP